MKLARFFRTVVETRQKLREGDYQKSGDLNERTWWLFDAGRWSFGVSTLYCGDQYGYVGSDSTRISLRVTRNPR
jgi:hypothetical protein